MHRFDSTEQYFTRAIDFGYSFSIEETLEKWGRDEIIGDYVRLIRMTRPDVMVGMNPTGTAGGLHHQTSGLLSREAFKAAGDASAIPSRFARGSCPWQPRQDYTRSGGPEEADGDEAQPCRWPVALVLECRRPSTLRDSIPLLGRTYVEIVRKSADAQEPAMGQLLALPTGPSQQRFL